LTDKGNDYVNKTISDGDLEMVERIRTEVSVWNRLIKKGEFLSYVSEKFLRYLSSDPRAKVGENQPFQENSVAKMDYEYQAATYPIGAMATDTMTKVLNQLTSQTSQIAKIRNALHPIQKHVRSVNSQLNSDKIVKSNIGRLQRQLSQSNKGLKTKSTRQSKKHIKSNIKKSTQKKLRSSKEEVQL
jgi:hypothetical protein